MDSLDLSANPISSDASSNSVSLNTVCELSALLLANVNTPSYHLTADQVVWINQFILASPDSFTKITDDIKSITATGEIGVHNIPQIVRLLADIYNNEALKAGMTNPANIIAFIKFTLDTILSSKLLILPDTEKELIKEIVDASLDLLATNLTPIEKGIAELESIPCCSKFLHFF